ncbi:MAG: ABC transporter ATP-binding protein, partial [Oculatellaceae cyanobacterium Prado106]|nr:ABC transporter ATP-binding protein [Oculatellaceae cyanobacterium Prado106]
MRLSAPIPPDQKATRQRTTLRRFFQYFAPYRKEIPFALSMVFIGAVSQSVGPFLIGWSIDNLIGQGNLRGLLLLLLMLTGVYLVGIQAIRQQILRVGSIMQRLLAQLRQ